jgi:hypothetical protein
LIKARYNTGLKCQGETLLDYPNTHLKKMKDRRVKQVFSRIGYQWEERGHQKRVSEVKFGCVLYLHMKIEDEIC